jgi:hypothetical protein
MWRTIPFRMNQKSWCGCRVHHKIPHMSCITVWMLVTSWSWIFLHFRGLKTDLASLSLHPSSVIYSNVLLLYVNISKFQYKVCRTGCILNSHLAVQLSSLIVHEKERTINGRWYNFSDITLFKNGVAVLFLVEKFILLSRLWLIPCSIRTQSNALIVS